MGEDLVSTILRSKMSSILENAEADLGQPSQIVSRFRSLIDQIQKSACPVPVDLLYQLIDALSECRVFSYERFKLTAAVSNKAGFFYLPRIHLPLPISKFMFERRMRKRLDTIENDLSKTLVSEQEPTAAPAIEQSYPIQDQSLIMGLEAQVDRIEAWLMSKEEKEEEWRGIGIVGEWGCGKTALAKKVFGRARIEEEFSPRMWVCLSNMEMDYEVNNIVKEVGQELEGKRYLIVLDDAWRLPTESLHHCLPKGKGKGAVIVTSRRENVVTRMFGDAKTHLIRLNPGDLSDQICWQIFSNQLQLQGKMDLNLSILEEVVKTKSKGRALAAKTLANVLPDMVKSHWIRARDLSIIWGDDARYWRWTSLPPPQEMEEVAELVRVSWLEIRGSLELNELVLKTSYSAYLVFKLNDKHCYRGKATTAGVRIVSDEKDAEWDQEKRRVFLDKENIQGEEEGYFPQAGGTGWMEIKLGEFFSCHGRLVQVIIQDTDGEKYGLIIKGIHFRPNPLSIL